MTISYAVKVFGSEGARTPFVCRPRPTPRASLVSEHALVKGAQLIGGEFITLRSQVTPYLHPCVGSDLQRSVLVRPCIFLFEHTNVLSMLARNTELYEQGNRRIKDYYHVPLFMLLRNLIVAGAVEPVDPVAYALELFLPEQRMLTLDSSYDYKQPTEEEWHDYRKPLIVEDQREQEMAPQILPSRRPVKY